MLLRVVKWGRQTRDNDEDCVEEGIQLARVKFDRDTEHGREALGMGNCSINILDRTELELAWTKKNRWKQFSNILIIWYFEYIDFEGAWYFILRKFLINKDLLQYFPKHLLLGQVIFENISYLIYFILLLTSFIYSRSFFITITIKWYFW